MPSDEPNHSSFRVSNVESLLQWPCSPLHTIIVFVPVNEKRTTVTENKTLHGVYGYLKQMEGLYKEAIESYEKSFDNAFYWTRLAESYEGLGDNEKAKEYYQKVSTHYLNTIQTALNRNKALTKLKEL